MGNMMLECAQLKPSERCQVNRQARRRALHGAPQFLPLSGRLASHQGTSTEFFGFAIHAV
jgi:hypothetical protein